MTEMIFKSQISLMNLTNQNYSPPALLQTMENPRILDPEMIMWFLPYRKVEIKVNILSHFGHTLAFSISVFVFPFLSLSLSVCVCIYINIYI